MIHAAVKLLSCSLVAFQLYALDLCGTHLCYVKFNMILFTSHACCHVCFLQAFVFAKHATTFLVIERVSKNAKHLKNAIAIHVLFKARSLQLAFPLLAAKCRIAKMEMCFE